MIFSSLKVAANDSIYPQAIRTALEYLRSKDFTAVAVGTYPIQGKDMYAMVMDVETKPVEEKKPEAHKRFIDVQYVCSGNEKLGYCLNTPAQTLVEGNDAKDLYFFADPAQENFVIATDGCYSIFFPEDLHRPGCMIEKPEKIRKVVVKINLDCL